MQFEWTDRANLDLGEMKDILDTYDSLSEAAADHEPWKCAELWSEIKALLCYVEDQGWTVSEVRHEYQKWTSLDAGCRGE